MPRPLSERQFLEQELAEIPAQIAAYRVDLEMTEHEQRARRERLDWQIREREKRLAEVERRLAITTKGSESDAPSPGASEV